MKGLLDKITFRLLIGQLLPGAVLTLTIRVVFKLTQVTAGKEHAPIGPLDIFRLYVETIKSTADAHDILILIIFSSILGLILHTTTSLCTANRESFRKTTLSDNHQWIQKDRSDIRVRSKLRNKIAKIWSNTKFLWIILIAPFVLLFDLFSILAAQPQNLYKQIYLVRAEAKKIEILDIIISEYEYLADYFGNMALALAAHLVMCIYFLDFQSSMLRGLMYLLQIYFFVSLHYISYRVVRTSIDQAFNLTFARKEQTERLQEGERKCDNSNISDRCH